MNNSVWVVTGVTTSVFDDVRRTEVLAVCSTPFNVADLMTANRHTFRQERPYADRLPWDQYDEIDVEEWTLNERQ